MLPPPNPGMAAGVAAEWRNAAFLPRCPKVPLPRRRAEGSNHQGHRNCCRPRPPLPDDGHRDNRHRHHRPGIVRASKQKAPETRREAVATPGIPSACCSRRWTLPSSLPNLRQAHAMSHRKVYPVTRWSQRGIRKQDAAEEMTSPSRAPGRTAAVACWPDSLGASSALGPGPSRASSV